LVHEGSIYDSDDGVTIDAECYGDAEHGEEMSEVDGAIEGINDPSWRRGDEITFRRAGRV
jgi:hypothetical protein